MRKLIALLILAAVGASAQVTNTVNISNSLLGPITNVFTNTQISVGEAIITGAVFNASVTNTFSPSITNEISVGAVSVTNNITNDISVTNIIENIAVAVTNTVNITNITQTFVTTSGVSSINGEEGAITFEGSGVTQTGTVFNFSGGGGGGDVTINGVTTNEFNFVYQYPVVGSNIGNTIYWGLVSLDGLVIQPAFTNYQTINFTGPTSTTYVVGVGVTQLVVHLWGGGGLGGTSSARAGGYTEVFMNVTTGEVLTVEIGEGSVLVPATNATGISTAVGGWPDGGVGVRRNNLAGSQGSGAGSTRLWRGTNLIAVAGAAGGAANAANTFGGAGGGLSGGTGLGFGGTGGGGGTQTQGGLTGSTAIPLAWTNTAGSFLKGGDGGVTTNNATGYSGGGGGGYYGGGGGLVLGTAAHEASGGGGSGYYNPDLVIYGITIRTESASPAGIDQPWYSTDTGGFGWGTGRSATRGGHGAVVIRTEF
jgi:hypothetical protein